MIQPRKLILTTALAVCGVVYAATPLAQGPMQPTEHHKRVLQGAGHWEGTLSMYMPGMSEASATECSEVVTALGDLWTTSRFECSFMGMPFTGSSTLGYDPKKGKYVGTWIDSMNPMLTVMEGDFDKEKNAIVMEYDMMDEMSGGMKRMRSYTTSTDTTTDIKFYVVDGEEETIQMEISMKRKPMATEASASK